MLRPRQILTIASLTFLVLAPATCTNLPPVAVPSGIIDCGIEGVTKLAISLIDDVNTCLAEGKQANCDAPPPASPPQTKCSWKSCLWDLAKKQGQVVGTEALLCAVDQAGFDFGSAYAASGDKNLQDSAGRAEEFITESGAKLKHRVEPAGSRPTIRK